jgi:hypothetical protein
VTEREIGADAMSEAKPLRIEHDGSLIEAVVRCITRWRNKQRKISERARIKAARQAERVLRAERERLPATAIEAARLAEAHSAPNTQETADSARRPTPTRSCAHE